MTTTLTIRVILECDRCSEPVRKIVAQSAYEPPSYEHVGTPCTVTRPISRTSPDLPTASPVLRPEPRRVCAADGGELRDASDAWANGQKCTVCGASWRMSLGD
ncbi:hypothetical protein OG592_41090 (plasmid) [Streptomyces avidinii]|uniref:hypothetical protein n=1 Tax=Streptomyces avidinii TaxID=1895 RepID=UPI002F910618|nr:hypothetical protein OG592_41090 [Streptomyces avidinii]